MGHPGGVPGARLILGPAGSGKTTLLRERYAELVAAGETGILFLVGSRRTARALQDRILRDVGASTSEVRVTTWHAFALSLLRTYFDALGYRDAPGLLPGPEQYNLVRAMLDSDDERAHWADFRRQTALAGFTQQLREFVLRAQDALRHPEELVALAEATRRPELAEAARFFRRYLTRLDLKGMVDHANAITRAVHLLGDPVGDEIRADVSHLLVDDLQDATPAQVELLARLVRPGQTTLWAAANPDASVFGFRGGTAAAIEEVRARFAPEVLALEPRAERSPKADAWLFDHLTEEAEAIARECRRLRARDGVGYGDIAIVVRRYGAASRAIRRALEAEGVPYLVVGENRPLGNEPILRPMLHLARAALGDATARDEHLPALLASPVCGLDPYEVRALRREASIRGLKLAALVDAPPDDLPQRMSAALHTLKELLAEIEARNTPDVRPDDVFWFLWERLDYFRDVVARGDDEELDAIAAFSRAIERFSDRRPGATFGEYLDVLAGVEFGPEPWNMPEERRPDAVRILTAHHAVGAEFEAVFVAGCVEGEFPDPHDARAMLDLRDLVEPATPFERGQARLEEERRLFGVAITRARSRLVLTAARESSQRESLTPSPLVTMAGLEWGPAPALDEPLTRDEAEARARRTLRDPSATEAERAEALDLLARLPGVDPDAWWFERDWTDPGIPIAPEELRTSYSRLSAYDNCALQYLYQVELGLDTETSHFMLVGTWVHDIVDRCARGEIPATEEALLAALDEMWDPTTFGAVAIEHRRRLDAEEMLRRWLAKDGKLDTLVSEVAFEFPIDGAKMRGRIDRVVRLGSSMVRLIDYKTSKNGKNMEEAKDDLQLASYFLALKRDPNLKTLGEPKYLELAYLGSFTRDGGFWRAGFDPTKREGFEQQAQERLEGFVAGIKAEEFAPSPSADCQWCRFKTLCPVWAEGDEVTV